MSSRSVVRIGTRGSALARWQADHVAGLLRAASPGLHVEIVVISTQGDRVLDKPLPLIGGKGVFTEELEAALRDGRIDVAVHSLKDLPTENPKGLVIGAVPPRADARDALVSHGHVPLSQLPHGAIVGTSSLRRIAQLRRLRPDLQVRDVRGNVDTRVRKTLELREYDAILLACAGLDRLNMQSVIAERLPIIQLLPAPGQAALGIQCRDETDSLALLAPLNDATSELCVTAERALLASFGGGCAVPVAAHATIDNGLMRLLGRVTAVDASTQVDVVVEGHVASLNDARDLGATAARDARARGAAAILPAVAKG
ncbi:MAG TPA: hydroxymethylbilane synthase [Tepidisphaeraceae bacterium]|jgi:hydroxymethylbilane synthase|nr:hydroxymethylbilane synthase [Tepidisphaeraceae bacterium]